MAGIERLPYELVLQIISDLGPPEGHSEPAAQTVTTGRYTEQPGHRRSTQTPTPTPTRAWSMVGLGDLAGLATRQHALMALGRSSRVLRAATERELYKTPVLERDRGLYYLLRTLVARPDLGSLVRAVYDVRPVADDMHPVDGESSPLSSPLPSASLRTSLAALALALMPNAEAAHLHLPPHVRFANLDEFRHHARALGDTVVVHPDLATFPASWDVPAPDLAGRGMGTHLHTLTVRFLGSVNTTSAALDTPLFTYPFLRNIARLDIVALHGRVDLPDVVTTTTTTMGESGESNSNLRTHLAGLETLNIQYLPGGGRTIRDALLITGGRLSTLRLKYAPLHRIRRIAYDPSLTLARLTEWIVAAGHHRTLTTLVFYGAVYTHTHKASAPVVDDSLGRLAALTVLCVDKSLIMTSDGMWVHRLPPSLETLLLRDVESTREVLAIVSGVWMAREPSGFGRLERLKELRVVWARGFLEPADTQTLLLELDRMLMQRGVTLVIDTYETLVPTFDHF